MVNICDPLYKARWKDIKGYISGDIPLQAIIGEVGLIGQLKEIHPWIKSSIKYWYKIISKNKLRQSYWLIKWIGCDKDFLPNKRTQYLENGYIQG